MSRLLLYTACLSLCVLLLIGPGCASPHDCKDNGDCPATATCRLMTRTGKSAVRVCVIQVTQGEVGSTCAQDSDCKDNFCYKPKGQDGRYCSRPCGPSVKEPCPTGFNCETIGQDLRVCALPNNVKPPPTEGCKCGRDLDPCTKTGHADCDVDKGYFCLSTGPSDKKAVCVRQCQPDARPGEEGSCNVGFVCSKSATGLFLCVTPQFTPGEVGKSCAKGGKAECQDDQFCYTAYPNDPNAFCTKYCNPYRENECGAGFACESPGERDPWLCIKKGPKAIGEDCSQRSFLECQSALCAKDNPRDEKSFCTQTCDPDQDKCPAGWSCRLFGHIYRYLCSKAGGGVVGALCTKNGAAQCDSGLCISPGPNAINKICTQKCDENNPCPGGFVCDPKNSYCLPKTGNKKIGDPCTSPSECVYGTCATDTSGKSFCTQRCTENAQCPTGYTCRNLEFTQRYCLPTQAGDKKLGEPCPNGPGDCAAGNCLADPVNSRTFCTQPCDDQQRPCPPPYVCTKLNDREAYCTPKDYSPP